jgi:hypothetical protein
MRLQQFDQLVPAPSLPQCMRLCAEQVQTVLDKPRRGHTGLGSQTPGRLRRLYIAFAQRHHAQVVGHHGAAACQCQPVYQRL